MFGMRLDSKANIGVNDLEGLIGQARIIDIREPYECASGMLETARNIPMNLLMMDPDNLLDRDQTYYIICHSGGRSGHICNLLKSRGFNVVNVVGGMASYRGRRIK